MHEDRAVRIGILAAGIVATLLLTAPADAAFPGTNGRIALQGAQRIDTINASGGDRRTVIGQAPSFFATPAWSPDGTKIAFASNREGADSELYVIGAGGTGIQTLTSNAAEDGAPTWSPDGRRIAFESDRDNPGVRSQIYVMNADGGGQAALGASPADDTAPAWSPDGTRIAFARSGNIWVTASSGGTGSALTSDPADETEPDWSPDGGRIVFQRGDGIAIMRADGGAQAPLAGAGVAGSPAWSPDGSRIAFERDLGILTVTPAGTGVTPLTTAGTTALTATNPSWQSIPLPAPPGGGGGTPPPGAVDADGDGVIAGLDCNDSNAGDPPRREGQARRQDRPGLRRRGRARPAARPLDRGLHVDLPGRPLHGLHVADRQAGAQGRSPQAHVQGRGLPAEVQDDQGQEEGEEALAAEVPEAGEAPQRRRRCSCA